MNLEGLNSVVICCFFYIVCFGFNLYVVLERYVLDFNFILIYFIIRIFVWEKEILVY